MKVAKSIILGLALTFISTNIFADEFSNQKMMCEFEGLEILITVPMPTSWTQEQKEKACESICNSLQKAEPMVIIKPATKKEQPESPKEAVCDTDYNCEVLWEKYNKYGIASIFVAPENRQRKGVNVLEIKCLEHNPITKYIASETELVSVCQQTIDILDAMEDEAKQYGEATEFSLDWYQLEGAIEANMIPIDRTSNDSPKTLDFLAFMKEHPEAEVSGVYRNLDGAKKACKLINQDNEQCYKNNTGIQITDITIRFGDSNEIPKWFKDFCENADNITEFTRGFWHCDW